MKTSTKIVIAVLLSFIMCFSINNYIYAASFNFSAGASASTLKPGDTITIDLKVSSIDAGELGINTMEAFLNYDENIFEPVSQSSFSGANNWSITYNGEDGANKGKLVAVILQGGVKEDQTIGNITLKVKEGVADTESSITFTNIKSNDGTAEITTEDKAINLKIATGSTNNNSSGSGSSSSGSGSTGSGTSGSGSTGSGSTGSSSTGSGSTGSGSTSSGAGASGGAATGGSTGSAQAPQIQAQTDSTANSKIPYAGEYSFTIIAFAMAVVAIIGVVIYIRYRKIDN